LWIAPEAQLTATALVPIIKGVTQRLPGGDIGELQVSGRERNESTGPGCYHAHRATHDQGRRGALAPRDSPLDMAGSANILFQVVVGPRQVVDLVAVKEPVPITLGDFAEVCHGRSQGAQLVLLLCHGREQLLILLLEDAHVTLLGVGQQVSGLVQPTVGLPDGRPELLRCCQSCSHEPLESAEFVGQPLFSATRPIESSIA